MGSERIVLVDGTGLLYRAFHAIPTNLKTTTGLPTNAVFGFARMFRKVLAGRRPAMGAVVFDAPGRTERRDAFEGYKRGRPPMPDTLVQQLPHVDRLVAAHNFPVVRVPGVEADDVLATLCRQGVEAGHDVWIVSGDKDVAQLVSEHVRWYDPTKELLYDADRVYRRFGVAPERFCDWIGLAGDAVDGIPGVPGVGDKSASELLGAHGSLHAILRAAEAGTLGDVHRKVAQRLVSHADQARQSRDLAVLRTDVAVEVGLEDLQLTFPTPEQLDAVYLDLEFFSLVSPAAQRQANAPDALAYFVVDSAQMAQAAIQHEGQGPDPVAVHVLVELPDAKRGALVGIALSPSLGRGLYFPFAGPGTHLGPEGLAWLRPWLEDPARPKIVYDAKEAMVALGRAGVTLRGVIGDPGLASYLVDPTKHLPHRLAQIAREYLHVGLQPIKGVIGTGRNRKEFVDLTVDRAGAWACHNADAAGAAWRTLAPRLTSEGQGRNHDEVDLPLSSVLARMERTGIRADPRVLEDAGTRLKAERRALKASIVELAGRTFNPGSHKQLGTVLFEELGLPVRKRTKTGYAVDAEVLHALREAHPIVSEVLRWRTVDKLIHTYTDVLLGAIAEDGRIHPCYQQTVSASGRIITTEPDLQRTPVRTPEFRQLREAFIASEGHQLVSADWSQVELRLLAHHSRDPALVDAFVRGDDVHRLTAGALFGVDPNHVTPAQREVGKTVNFATIYGQGPTALARQLEVPTKTARAHIQRFFDRYAGVARWRDTVVTEAHADGYVTTQLGRRRYLPELWSGTPADRAHGERAAVNTPIQGSGADLCKVAMVRIAARLRAEGLAAEMVLQIHDEILVDAPEHEVDAVTTLLTDEMCTALPLSVPLVVDVGVGRTWGQAHT